MSKTKAEDLMVRVGDHDRNLQNRESFDVINVTVSPNYDSNLPTSNRIALLELDYCSIYPAVDLATFEDLKQLTVDTTLTALGWVGNSRNSVSDYAYGNYGLNEIALRLVPLELCKTVTGWTDRSICVERLDSAKSPCLMDRGSLLLLRTTDVVKQVGTISLGEAGCSTLDKYGVYTSTPYVYDWLVNTIHNIEYTQNIRLGWSSDLIIPHRFTFTNHRKDTIFIGTPIVSQGGRIKRNRCIALAPNQSCYIDVEFNNRDKKPVFSGILKLKVIHPKVELVSKISYQYIQTAPRFHSTGGSKQLIP